jgi:hypothetical protein
VCRSRGTHRALWLEGPRGCRLAAGGKRIRTHGPNPERNGNGRAPVPTSIILGEHLSLRFRSACPSYLSADTWDQEFDPFPPALNPVRTTGSGATASGTARPLGERRKRSVCGSSPSELRSYLVTRAHPGMQLTSPQKPCLTARIGLNSRLGPTSSMIDRKCERD